MRILAAFLACSALVPMASGQGFSLDRNLAYVDRQGQRQTMDLYRPKAKADKPYPVALLIHGGGWNKGSKLYPDVMIFVRMMLELDIACAAISYRLAPQSVYPAQIQDCQRAIQYLRHNASKFGIDPHRIAAVGASAGGHLAALMGTQPDQADATAEDLIARQSTKPTCVIDYFGPMILESDSEVGKKGEALVRRFLGCAGEPTPRDIMRARDASPLLHLTRDDPPILLVHGDRDPLVPLEQSQRMARACAALGICHEMVVVANGSHGDFMAVGLALSVLRPPTFWGRTQAFLKNYLIRVPGDCPAKSEAPALDKGAATKPSRKNRD